jgi:hypothetical protein
MRTTIVLDRNERGEWDDALGRIDVSHEEPLSEEAVEALRELGRLARERMESGNAPAQA